MMGWKLRQIRAIALAFVVLLGPAGMRSLRAAHDGSANTHQVRLLQLIESNDVRVDESALSGASGKLLSNPEEWDAGVWPAVIVIALLVDTVVMGLDNFVVSPQMASGEEQAVAGVSLGLDAVTLAVEAGGGTAVPGAGQAFEFSYEFCKAAKDYMEETGENSILYLVPYTPQHEKMKNVARFEAANAFFATRKEAYPRVAAWVYEYGGFKNDVELSVSLYKAVTQTTAPLSHSGGELIKGGSFSSSSDLKYWQNGQAAMAGLSSFGPIVPPEYSSDGRFGLIPSGTAITQTVLAPATMNGVMFVSSGNLVGSASGTGGVTFMLHAGDGSRAYNASMTNGWTLTPSAPSVHFDGGLPTQILGEAHTSASQTNWHLAVQPMEFAFPIPKGTPFTVTISAEGGAMLIDGVSLQASFFQFAY